MIKFYKKLQDVDGQREISSLVSSCPEYEGKGIGTVLHGELTKGVAVCFDEENKPYGFVVLNLESGRELMVENMFAIEYNEEAYKELYSFIKDFATTGKKDKISVYPDKENEKLVDFYQKNGFKIASYQEGEGAYLFMTKMTERKYGKIAELISYLEKQAKSTKVMSYARSERQRRENSFIRKAEKELQFNVSQYLDTPEFIASAILYEEMSANGMKLLDLKKAVLFKKTQPEYYQTLQKACPVSFKHFEKWLGDCLNVFEAKELEKTDKIAKADRERKAYAKTCVGTQISLDIE